MTLAQQAAQGFLAHTEAAGYDQEQTCTLLAILPAAMEDWLAGGRTELWFPVMWIRMWNERTGASLRLVTDGVTVGVGELEMLKGED